jgi:hypothetical protein
MARMKTSIYVDRELWTRFREHAIKSGVKASRLLEDLMEDGLRVNIGQSVSGTSQTGGLRDKL